MSIKLPISKSIANRILLLQAIHGDPLMRVSSDMPDDVIVLHDALQQIRDTFGTPAARKSPFHSREGRGEALSLNLKNCGTALRFLQVHLAKCYPDAPVTLTGDPRLMERDGKPTTQTTSARILHGDDIPVAPDESPYISMSRRMASMYQSPAASMDQPRLADPIEPCWSSAAFWYEYIAIHGGGLLLEGLTSDSLQGDRIVADLYAQHFGVQTTFTAEGARIFKSSIFNLQSSISLDFERIPDLYPPVALTCERLGITLNATGTDRLRYKESDRLEAVRLHEVRNDHRIAMALMAADFPVSESDQSCIAKSYPGFAESLHVIQYKTRRSADGQPTVNRKVVIPTISHVTPIRGVNDDNLGKKHALSKLIHAATTDYLWLHDDDILLPPAANLQSPISNLQSDLLILPLKMESEQSSPSLLEKLQIAEYAAIQELTMRTAKRGKAVMCSGANLIVRREVWLACESRLHPEIPSGDDMFLLEAVKLGGYKIGVIDDPAYTAVVRPLTSWRAFLHQRMRWAGKAPHYTDKDIRRCGLLISLANIAQLLCPPILLIKFPIEYSLIRKRMKKNLQSSIFNLQLFSIALLLEILYPIYMLVAFFGGLLHTNRW